MADIFWSNEVNVEIRIIQIGGAIGTGVIPSYRWYELLTRFECVLQPPVPRIWRRVWRGDQEAIVKSLAGSRPPWAEGRVYLWPTLRA